MAVAARPKLIVPRLASVYSGRLVACSIPMNFLHLPPILGVTKKMQSKCEIDCEMQSNP